MNERLNLVEFMIEKEYYFFLNILKEFITKC